MKNAINIINNNGQLVVSSRQVAENFGKRHDHVIRAIQSIEKDVPNFGEMFFLSTEPDSYGREQQVYLMNRDGVTLLLMSFTGKEARAWQLKYIQAFNEMEQKLKSLSLPSYQIEDKVERAKRWIQEQEEHEAQVAVLQPKADYYNEWMDDKWGLCATEVAKPLGLDAQYLNQKLHEYGVIYRKGYRKNMSKPASECPWVLSKEYAWMVKEGYALYLKGTYGKKVKIALYWTGKGAKWIEDFCEEHEIWKKCTK